MTLTLVYDGGCPFCRSFALRSELGLEKTFLTLGLIIFGTVITLTIFIILIIIRAMLHMPFLVQSLMKVIYLLSTDVDGSLIVSL